MPLEFLARISPPLGLCRIRVTVILKNIFAIMIIVIM